jgi:hypothetical protein
MANKIANKKPKRERMVILGLRIPRSLLNRLERRAKKESERSGTVNVSAVARALLQEHV